MIRKTNVLMSLGRGARLAHRGFTLVSAVFLLVVLAGLGVAMVTFSTSQHVSSALDVQGTRAYQAARAGIEWGLYRQLIDGACVAQTSFVLPGNTLNTFTVTVTCTRTAVATVNPNVFIYTITAQACNIPTAGACPGNGGQTNYVARQLTVRFENTT